MVVCADLTGRVTATMSPFSLSRIMEQDQSAAAGPPPLSLGSLSTALTPNTSKELLKTTGVMVMPPSSTDDSKVTLTLLPVGKQCHDIVA